MIKTFNEDWKWFILLDRLSKELLQTPDELMEKPIAYLFNWETFYRKKDKVKAIINGR